MEVVVIGAGLGGLSTAMHLRGRGHDVVVLERGDVPGGRAGILRRDGYRFDTGPTVLTMIDIIADCFTAVGADMADHLKIFPVDPMYRAVFEDNSELRVWHGRERMAKEIRSFAGPDAAKQFHKFCDWLTKLYRLEMPNFIDRNFNSLFSIANPLPPGIQLFMMGGFGKVANRVAKYFDDERLQRIFSFQSLYAGLAPQQALAIYCVITYMDTVAGVFQPVGGMHAIPQAMADAAELAGVEFRYGTEVDRIILEEGTSGRVRGVRLAGTGEMIEADAVVCNPDLPVAYRTLLPGTPMPLVARRGTYSPSCVVWHVGARGELPPGVGHHNIHFGQQWDQAFKALLKEGRRMPDPSILVSVPTYSDPTAAPEGCHSLFVLEPTPNLDGKVDWTRERHKVRDDLSQMIEKLGYPIDIQVEELVDPTDWERMGMERGTPFALSHRFLQTGPFRPNNIDKRAPGLVFVGSSTLPGVGVPMVLISGRLAAERVDELYQ